MVWYVSLMHEIQKSEIHLYIKTWKYIAYLVLQVQIFFPENWSKSVKFDFPKKYTSNKITRVLFLDLNIIIY
jgi:hypothetical protein